MAVEKGRKRLRQRDGEYRNKDSQALSGVKVKRRVATCQETSKDAIELSIDCLGQRHYSYCQEKGGLLLHLR